ncbi:MAG: hypothetical protein ABIK09_16290 [Pseudomonadota bacterium]
MVRVFLVCAWVSMVACGGGNGVGGGGANIDIDPEGPEGGASGIRMDLLAGTVVEFLAMPLGPDQALARYSEVGGVEVTVSITGPGEGSLTVDGVTVDGLGALTEVERAALEALTVGPMAEALTLIPLEIGCHGGADLEPAAMAALLLPWQIVSKYLETDRVAAALDAAARSSCRYFPEIAPDGSGAAATHLLFGPEVPLPVVFGFFPFDEFGAIDGTVPFALPPAPTASAMGISGSRCRGACGLGCTTTNCKVKEAWYCVAGADESSGEKEKWQTFSCGVAAGCIVHDDCYDECNALYGVGSFWAIHCRHARFNDSCDSDAQSMYGIVQCTKWAAGYGPYDAIQDFQYPVAGTRVGDPECGEEPDVRDGGEDAGGPEGAGACVFHCQTCCPDFQEIWGCHEGFTSQAACVEESFPEVPECVSISYQKWYEGKSCAAVCGETTQMNCPAFWRPEH